MDTDLPTTARADLSGQAVMDMGEQDCPREDGMEIVKLIKAKHTLSQFLQTTCKSKLLTVIGNSFMQHVPRKEEIVSLE